MALDEPSDLDEVFTIDGFDYIVNKDFLNTAKPIKVDFHEYGFSLSSSIKFGSGCSSCGSSSGSCG